MFRGFLILTACVCLASFTSASAEILLVNESNSSPISAYRGWDYLVNKLKADGISETEIVRVYQNPKMPTFGPIYFSLEPKESHRMYSHFLKNDRIKLGQGIIKKYRQAFISAEQQLGVTRYVIAAILLVETHGGRILGSSLVINRLSRLAALSEPGNVQLNYHKLLQTDPDVKLEDVTARAKLLDKMFYPEIPALFQIAKKNKVNLLGLKGSGAGAFGIPQFLPTSYLQFALDGNGDQVVSLFDHADAIWSAGNFLKSFGWNEQLSLDEKKRVVLKYNNSEAYADTVLRISELLSTKQ